MKNIINVDLSSKENIDPNIEYRAKYKISKEKQNANELTPKKKIIHLKSISRNSKSKKGNSGSMNKKYSLQQNFT